MTAASLEVRNSQKVHTDMITSLDVPYTGNSDYLYSASRDKKIYKWQLNGHSQERIGTLLREYIGQNHHINGVKCNKTNEIIVSVSSDKTGRIHNINKDECYRLIGHKNDVTGVTINSDDNKIVTSSYDGSISLWNTKGELSMVLTPEDNQSSFLAWVLCCAFVPNTSLVVTGSSDGRLRIWDIEAGKVTHTFINGHLIEYYSENELPIPEESMITALSISADGSFCAYGGRDSHCYIISITDKVQVLSFNTDAPINSLSFSITEPIIAVATRQSIMCWHVITNELILNHENEIKTKFCTSLVWARNNLVTGWNDGEIKVFDFIRRSVEE